VERMTFEEAKARAEIEGKKVGKIIMRIGKTVDLAITKGIIKKKNMGILFQYPL